MKNTQENNLKISNKHFEPIRPRLVYQEVKTLLVIILKIILLNLMFIQF